MPTDERPGQDEIKSPRRGNEGLRGQSSEQPKKSSFSRQQDDRPPRSGKGKRKSGGSLSRGQKKGSLVDLPIAPISEPRTEEKLIDHLTLTTENNVREKCMACSNFLEIPRAPTVYELQVRQLEECNKQAKSKRRRLENQAA